MAEARITRRRALVILAAGGAAAVTRAAGRAEAVEWKGTALGADARIVFVGGSAVLADCAVAECLAEIDRLEQIFSLYRETSEICSLNLSRSLADASPEMRQVLHMCAELHRCSEGLFDPTVQSLWRQYEKWYGSGETALSAAPIDFATLSRRVGFERVAIQGRRVALPSGMEITLNGIAQGYITDRIAELLKRRGFTNVLIDIGEVRALGARDEGTPFEIGIRGADLRVPLSDGALATSEPGALAFSSKLGLGHILDPKTGVTPRIWRSITVRHPSAAMADGLSTALSLAPPEQARRILDRVGASRAWAFATDGKLDNLRG